MSFTPAAGGAELVSGRGAAVAVPAHDVGSTLTLPSTGLAHRAERTLRVTLACWEIDLEGERNFKSSDEENCLLFMLELKTLPLTQEVIWIKEFSN